MRKLFAIILCLCMLFAVLPIHAEEREADIVKIYVSPTGNDDNSGTFEKPLKSLHAARDAAREFSGDSEIVLMEGEYILSEALVLDNRDSNTSWASAEGERAVITSAERITDWSLHDSEKNIYKAKVKDGFITRQVYFNGEKAKRSRSILYNKAF